MSTHLSSPSEIFLHGSLECRFLAMWTRHPRADQGAMGPLHPLLSLCGCGHAVLAHI